MPLSDYQNHRVIVVHLLTRESHVDEVRKELTDHFMGADRFGENRDWGIGMITMDHCEVELGDMEPTEDNLAEMRAHGMDAPPLLIDRTGKREPA